MAVDGLTHNAAPAPAPPKSACGRSLFACGHSVGRVVQGRPLTSGRHEHTEQLGVSWWKPSQEASGGASGGRCEEVMRMRKPQPVHGRRARAAVLGGSPCGRDPNAKRRPCTGGDPAARLSSAARPWIATRTGASSRRLTAGTRTLRPGQTTCRSLPRSGPHSNTQCGGSRRAFQSRNAPGNYHAGPGGR
jgi:hypothetical protein